MKTDNKAILAYLAVCFFWGSTYLAIKIGVHGFPPFVLAGFRHTIAGTIMLSATLLLKKSFPKDKKDILLNILVGMLMLAGANGLVTLAEQWVDSGITSLLVSLVPVYIVIIQWIVLKTIKVSWQGIIGIGLGFFGVYLLVNPSATIQIIDPLGVTILLFGCFLWSLGSLVSTLIKSKETLFANLSIQMLSGGVGCLIISLFTGGIYDFTLTPTVWGALWYLIIFGSIIGFGSYIYLLQHWPATKAGTYAYVNPIVAVILGAIVLNEQINWSIALSIVIILSGVFLVQKSKVKV